VCGSQHIKGDKSKHLKTKKHINYIKSQSEEINGKEKKSLHAAYFSRFLNLPIEKLNFFQFPPISAKKYISRIK
jgi:hypothetical protein